MKKTQRKDAARNIKKRLVSYLSVCLVVALGLGGVFMTSYMGAGLSEKTAEFYDEHNFWNFELASSLGISESNLDKIKSAEGVKDAEGIIDAEGSVSFGSQKRNAAIFSLTERISVPDIKKGRMPEGTDECLIGEDFAEVEGLKPGDRISLSLTGLNSSKQEMMGGNEDKEGGDEEASSDLSDLGDGSEDFDISFGREDAADKPALLSTEFTVTGLMRHPDYLRRKTVNTVALPLEAFNKEVTEGLYTRAYVRTEDPDDVSILSDEYFEKADPQRKKLVALSEELADDRAREVRDEANAYIDEEWEKAQAKLDDAEDEIASGEALLNSKLAEGRSKLKSAEKLLDKTVAEYNRKLKNGDITVPEYKKTIKQLEKELEEAKAALSEAQKLFANEFVWLRDFLDEAIPLLEELEKLQEEAPTYGVEKIIAQFLLEHQEEILDFHKRFYGEELERVKRVLDIVKKYTGQDMHRYAEELANLNTQELIDASYKVLDDENYPNYHYTSAMLKTLRNAIDAIDQAQAALANAQKRIREAEKKLAEGKKKAQKLIDAKEAEGRKKIKEGWNKYYSEKTKYGKKLEEAKALLADNEEKARDKLAEARESVKDISCRWIVLDRMGNAGFVDMKTNLDAIDDIGLVFGMLFAIITAIVCFSTLVIIIDEQKTLVGTVKAFGFYKREILAKYLVFGISAAVAGSILAALGAVGLSGIMQKVLAASGMYAIEPAGITITPVPTILFSLLIISVTVAATVIACGDILRSPASMLMNGAVLRREKKNKPKKKKIRKGGSLYSRLIIRNMAQDKARVIVTIAIIAFSCLLMGIGISMKFAYSGMLEKQVSDVNRFDVRMDMNEEVTDEDEAALVKVLEGKGAAYLPATSENLLYRSGDGLDALQLICADSEKIGEFYGITDPETGAEISPPDSGLLIQKRMHESYGLDVGDRLTVLDSSLVEHEAEIKGYFTNYAGRAVIASPAAYSQIFAKDSETNCYFIRLSGADKSELEEALLAVSDNISFEEDDEFMVRYEAGTKLYNLLVLITTLISIFISFMILTNLANIYLNRKKTELTVMRINGFRVSETKAYLSREAIFTTVAGLVLGVAIGALLTPQLIRTIQQPDTEFIKSFSVIAWSVSAGLEGLFSLVINSLVFRKVKYLNLRDIA